MKNVLIVESKNDQQFIEALIRDIELENTVVDNPICRIDDFDCLGGLSEKKLTLALQDKVSEITKGKISRIGVLIDQDKHSRKERLSFVSRAVQNAFDNQQIKIEAVNHFYIVTIDEYTTVEIVCYFTNVEEEGELETLLKAIKTKDSPFADCLEAWRGCIESNNKKISQKDFDKFWISNYIRFDTCSSKEKKQAERKCSMQNFDYILKNKNIFNLKHELLTDLRAFLNLFKG